ncbi:transposase [Propionivibrio dicarboxylicus]|uniref:transposase n=1 Tax=Propionivibrio dicarboxylicus TaxID=83767 RepID=UPI000B820C5D
MKISLLSDDLWAQIVPLLPPPRPRRTRYPGRKPLDDRSALNGILYVLTADIHWEALPDEIGCGSGLNCLRRLKTWQQFGVWNKVRTILVSDIPATSTLDWSRCNNASVTLITIWRQKRESAKIGSPHG